MARFKRLPHAAPFWPAALLLVAALVPTALICLLARSGLKCWACQAKPQMQDCTIDTTGSPFIKHCVALKDVCVDYPYLILHGDKYQQVGLRPPVKMPVLDSKGPWGNGIKMRYPWLMGGTNRGSEVEAALKQAKSSRASRHLRYVHMDPRLDSRQVPLPLLRPASSLEPREYLAQPTWSSCTVPVIWRPMWQDNLHHAFRDTGSQLLSALEATSWRKHIKLALLTGDGLGMLRHMDLILNSLTNLTAESFADFSMRLPLWGGTSSPVRRLNKCAKPQSYEGGNQRCFRQLFFCGNGTLGMDSSQYRFGQHMVHWMREEHLLPHAAASPPCTGACKLQLRDSVVMLRVALHKRSSPGRQLLNTAELLEQCKSWSYLPEGRTTTYKLNCSEVELTDLPSGAAAALEADVFVGLHGANLQNSMFLQPGGSVVEVVPFQYDKSPWGHALAQFNMADPTTRLLWWSIVACDAKLSTPGLVEAEGVYDELEDKSTSNYARNRNVRVQWAALEAVLQRVVDARGDVEMYKRQYYETGAWRVFMWESKIQSPSHPSSRTCPS